MRDVLRWSSWVIAGIAVVVMVVGLLPTNAPVDDAARAEAIAGNLRCPFCNGESIAEAPSQIARDLELFVVDKVEEGWTDEQIYTYFVDRYGERVRLDPPLAGWGAALWLSPLVVVAVGIAAIFSRRRERQERAGTEAPAPAALASSVVDEADSP